MSLASLCSITTATLKRVVSTQGSAGGEVRNYTTANRGTLPTASTGRLVQGSGNRRFDYQMHDLEIDATWYTLTDPQCDERDVLVIGSDTYFVQSKKNPDLLNRYFSLTLKLYTRELQ